MALYENFPYTNYHDINLDRIIQQLMEVKEGLQFVIDNASLKYADPLQWSITHQYQANTVVIDPETGIAYISTKPVPDNILITDTGYWTQIFDLSEMFRTIKESISFNLETGSNSAHSYQTGNYIFVDSVLYKVISDISVGTAFAENVNIKKVSVTDELETAETNITTLLGDVSRLDGRIDDLSDAFDDLEDSFDELSPEVISDVNTELIYKFNSVFISTIRNDHPDYTDDQLMSAAITMAADMASHPLIVWDHHDARFSGSVTFNLSATSGIDFNHQNVYMPAVDVTLFELDPDDSEDKNVSSALLSEYYVSDPTLYNKYFAVNSSNSGSSGMCAGNRHNSTGEIYVCYGVVTDPKGQVTNDKMNYLPATTTVVPLYNVHTIPSFVTVLKNANVIYPAQDKMALLLRTTRSRIHISNITVQGYTTVTTYHTGVISLSRCAYIEIDHIYGSNPIQESLASGYLISMFNGCTDIYIHDCDMHDSEYQSWGMLGTNCMTNVVMERVNTDRFDCHYFAFGYVRICDCHLNYVNMSAGVCNWTIDSCMFTRRTPTIYHYIGLRSDSPGRFAGELRVTNCRFRNDPSNGADVSTLRLINLSMVHNLLGSFTATGILNAYSAVYLSDCNIESALCVFQCEDIDSGNGTSNYNKANFFVNNCNINLAPSAGVNRYFLYRYQNTNISAVNMINIAGSQIIVSHLTTSEIFHLYITGSTFNVNYPLLCTKTVTDCIITGSRFGGFDTSQGTIFNNLVCSGNDIAKNSSQWNSSISTNYVLSGNTCSYSSDRAAWIASNSYGI